MDLDTIIQERFLKSTIKIYKKGKYHYTRKLFPTWEFDAAFDVKILAVSDLEMNDCYDGYGDDMKVTLTLEPQEGLIINSIEIWINQGNDSFELTEII